MFLCVVGNIGAPGPVGPPGQVGRPPGTHDQTVVCRIRLKVLK